MTLAYFLAFIVLGALAYRLKGGWWAHGGNWWNDLGTLLMGWMVAVAAGAPFEWTALVCMGAWWLGEKPGVGSYMGKLIEHEWLDYEKWQFGILKKNPWLACAFRGLIWCIPLAPLAWFYPEYTVAVGIIPAMLLGAATAGLFKWRTGWRHWEAIEAFSGAWFGAWLAWSMV